MFDMCVMVYGFIVITLRLVVVARVSVITMKDTIFGHFSIFIDYYVGLVFMPCIYYVCNEFIDQSERLFQ